MNYTCSGSGRINVEMLEEGKWCPGYLVDVWYVPDIGRHLFSVRSAEERRFSLFIERQLGMF
jgi:hypothetical protein